MRDPYELVEAAIKRLGGKQAALARAVNSDAPTISRLRRKQIVPSLELAIALEEHVHIPCSSWKRIISERRKAA